MELPYSNFHILNSESGVATLPTVFTLMILILAVVVGMTAWSMSEMFSSESQNQSSKALFYAEAGAKDALMRIARNKNYSTSTYQLSFVSSGCATDEGCATITVSSAMSPKVITSDGQVNNNIRKIKVDVYFDGDSNGEITNVNWQEITD